MKTPPNSQGYPRGTATELLFQSGNPNPPIGFQNYAGFANWLYPLSPVGTKEYRAAFYLEGVEAEFSDDGSPPRADYTANEAFPGYTPYRFFSRGVNLLGNVPRLPQYGSGYGPIFSPTVVPDRSGDWVELRYRAEFKLSSLSNVFSKILTNSWAPYAWCEIVYRFEKSGRIEIHVDGSAIPNRRLYLNWMLPRVGPPKGTVAEYDMLGAVQADVAGFIRTKGWGCRPAPVTAPSRLTWSGQGR